MLGLFSSSVPVMQKAESSAILCYYDMQNVEQGESLRKLLQRGGLLMFANSMICL